MLNHFLAELLYSVKIVKFQKMSHCIESAYIIATLIGCFIAARLINFILDWQHRKKLENVGKARFVRVSESWIECNGSSEIKSEHVDENGAKSEHENENEIISEDHRLKKVNYIA